MYVGFVSHEKDANEDAWPSMARGRGWARIVPEGSDSPGFQEEYELLLIGISRVSGQRVLSGM